MNDNHRNRYIRYLMHLYSPSCFLIYPTTPSFEEYLVMKRDRSSGNIPILSIRRRSFTYVPPAISIGWDSSSMSMLSSYLALEEGSRRSKALTTMLPLGLIKLIGHFGYVWITTRSLWFKLLSVCIRWVRGKCVSALLLCQRVTNMCRQPAMELETIPHYRSSL